ncbi:hypothetical protein BH23CHL2_BH23CHL2_03990 [soil metagenome]
MADSEREASIDIANEAYASAREYIEGIDEADMLRPDRVGIWSGKDLVIHIADWEAEAVRLLQDIEQGKPERWVPEGMDGNTFNEERVRDHASKTLQGAMDYWAESHDRLISTYRKSSVDREDILFGHTRNHYRGHYPDFRHVKPFKGLTDEERAQLLEDMDASHDAFLELIGSIDDDALLKENTVGTWSGKNLIAHLGHWQQAAIDLTRELENDRPGKWPGEDGSNINEWNEARVQEMRDHSLQDVRSYQQERFDELRELIRTSPYATRSAGIGATGFHYGLHEEDFRNLE